MAETLQTLLEKFQSHLNDTQRLTLAGVAILEKMRVGRQTQLDMDHLLGEAAVLDGATLQELGAVEWNADLGQYELIADATTRGQFQQWLRRKQSGLAAEAARDLFLRRGARDCEHLQPAGCLVAPIWIVGLADRQGTLADPNTRSHFLHQAILESSTLRFLAEDSVQRWRELLNRWDAEESYQGKVVLADEAKRMIRVDPLPETLEGLYRYLCDQAGEASAKLREARQRLDDLERGIEKAERHEDVERLLKLTSRLAEQRRELENTARWPERYQRDAETLWSAIRAFVTPARHRLDFAAKLPESRASSRFPPSDGNRTEMKAHSTPGKIVGQRTYFHIEAGAEIDPAWADRWRQAERLAGVARAEHYNLVRIDVDGPCVALLNYPDFFAEPFPALRESWLVNLEQETVAYRTYADSLNPPILHRKELLLPTDHPLRAEYAALTETAEAIGLFDHPTRIGYQRQWLALVREKGYRIAGHALVPLGNVEDVDEEAGANLVPPSAGWESARQRTALTRSNFSAPVQTLARYGFLDGPFSLFDYGCGRGDDVRGLRENDLSAAGWDPYYAPDQPIHPADLVNLGFVINVIEDRDERLEALICAWSLAERLLVIAVMLANQNDPRGERFRDGVLTQRGTFQKYYTQAEIKAFIEATLDEEAIPVAPGVLYVFRDKEAEQRFLMERYRSRRNPLRRPTALTRERPAAPRRDRVAEKYARYQEPLDRLWIQCLALGRRPEPAEIEDATTLIEGFGSLAKALRFIADRYDPSDLERARTARIADLEVYFALTQFERRKPYTHLERGLQRDIKMFFGDYPAAQSTARERLFQIADVAIIEQACQTAAEQGLGWLEPGQSLQLHTRLVEQLPPVLRIYVGCAAVLYGDYRHADLVKIHIASGKVSLLRFDDFENQPLPRLIERVKIKLREQNIDYFAYGDRYAPPFLYHKSRYLNEEFPNYPEQVAFEEALEKLELFDLSGYGPRPGEFLDVLARHRWTFDGFELKRMQNIPDLDDACGAYLAYRQLIECGETWANAGLDNRPRQPNSYTALLDLALNVLDPVIDYFGMIRLTYGFCSPALARRIPGRIDPKRDQHAGHEVNRQGRTICDRLGAAVDFIVEDENMLEVAQWIAANTPFDRLYFYDVDQPIHVSFGPNHDRQVVCLVASPSGRSTPRVIPRERFLALERQSC